jgi:hypothetical protein
MLNSGKENRVSFGNMIEDAQPALKDKTMKWKGEE